MHPMILPRNRLTTVGYLSILGFGLLMLYLNWGQLTAQIVDLQREFHAMLVNHINRVSEDAFGHGISLLLLSFAYGVFHAIGPGHGKVIIATYLGTHRESLAKGACISMAAALLQATVAVLLVSTLARVLSIPFSKINAFGDDMTSLSYVLVMALGLFLTIASLFRLIRYRRQLKNHNGSDAHALDLEHSHDHEAAHDHGHDHHGHDAHAHHGCCHGHVPENDQSLAQSLAVIFSMGIRPCTGAILVLIYAHLVDAYFFGVLAALVMGLGTGLAVAAIAVGTQVARNWFEALAGPETNPSGTSVAPELWVRIIGGLVIFVLGLSLFQASYQVAVNHPLV